MYWYERYNVTSDLRLIKCLNDFMCCLLQADQILCKAKMLMKNSLSIVLEKEMKVAYDDLWLVYLYKSFISVICFKVVMNCSRFDT